MSDKSTTTKKLSFWDCMGFCIGQIIGSGIMVLTGIVVGLTGHGTPYAFIGAAVLAIVITLPSAVLASSIPSNGAGYSYLKRLIGDRTAFFYLCSFVITQVLIATFAKGFASYVAALIPGVNETLIAIGIIVVAVAINYIGLKTSAIVQNLMVVFLLLALAMFIAFGLPHVQWANFVPTAQNIMPNGLGGFLMGIALLSFATGGAKFIAENGDEIENPGKNIPRAMIFSTLLVAGFYALIGIVAAGVLPIEEVAFQNLTLVAQRIFSPALYVFFIVGGAMFALLTTLNGTLSWVTRGLQAAAKEGWLPAAFAKESKGGAPVLLLILFGLVGIVPIATGMNTESIAAMGVGLDMLCEFMVLVACFRLPKKFPNEFKNASFTFKEPVFYGILIFAGILMLGTSYVSLEDLSGPIYVVIAVYLAAILALTFFRYPHMLKKRAELQKAAGKTTVE